NRGETGEARAALAAIHGSKELHIRSIDNAAKAMEDLLLERGGLGSVRRILDQFFDRPIVRTAMSDDLKERAQPHDQKAIQDMIKAQYYSLLRERGPETARERVYKLLPTDTYLSLNHIIRLESSVNMVVDSKSKSKPKPWVLKDADRARIEAAL
ncbi:MAG: hypothetical protein VYB01_11340, partial [Pseudomonadota bacterium]|nr:hypothetical protein [Pseudomonadota bacterium]